ncbi:MAG: hypothetical protein ACJ74H_09385, partial [Thermoanaerobaculia bacterium]
MKTIRTLHLIAAATLLISSAHATPAAGARGTSTVQVSGSGFDGLNAALVHSKEMYLFTALTGAWTERRIILWRAGVDLSRAWQSWRSSSVGLSRESQSSKR